jgi:Secretion system C-terminal sorting domain
MKKIILTLLFITCAHHYTNAQCSPVWPNSLTASASSAPVGSSVSLNAIYTTNPPFNVNHRYKWANITDGSNCGSGNNTFGQESIGVAFGENSPALVAGNNIFTLRFDCVTGVQCNPPLQVTVFGVSLMATNEFNTNNSFKIYPNPATDVLNIETDNELKSAEIYSLLGQKVLTSNSKQINVSSLAKGIYMVRIENENNAVGTQKLIIE